MSGVTNLRPHNNLVSLDKRRGLIRIIHTGRIRIADCCEPLSVMSNRVISQAKAHLPLYPQSLFFRVVACFYPVKQRVTA